MPRYGNRELGVGGVELAGVLDHFFDDEVPHLHVPRSGAETGHCGEDALLVPDRRAQDDHHGDLHRAERVLADDVEEAGAVEVRVHQAEGRVLRGVDGDEGLGVHAGEGLLVLPFQMLKHVEH